MPSPTNRLHSVPPGCTACGTAAICAITGASKDEAERALRTAIAEDGMDPGDLASALPKHVGRALELLDWELVSGQGNKIDARRQIRPLGISLQFLGTVADFLQQNTQTDILLCTAFKAGAGDSHTFAVDGHELQDNGLFANTSETSSWRVARTLGCRRAANPSSSS